MDVQQTCWEWVSSVYMQKVDDFVTFACGQGGVLVDELLKCPCAKCQNLSFRESEIVKLHL